MIVFINHFHIQFFKCGLPVCAEPLGKQDFTLAISGICRVADKQQYAVRKLFKEAESKRNNRASHLRFVTGRRVSRTHEVKRELVKKGIKGGESLKMGGGQESGKISNP